MKSILFSLLAISVSASVCASDRCEVFLRSDNKKEFIEIATRGTDFRFALIEKKTGFVIPEFDSTEYEKDGWTYQYVALGDGRELLCQYDDISLVVDHCAEVTPGSSRIETFFLIPQKTRSCRVL